MKCELYYQNKSIMDLNLEIGICGCTVNSYVITGTLPKILDFVIRYPDEALGVLSVFLSTRIPPKLQEMSDEQIIKLLNLSRFSYVFGRMEEYLFIPAFLWHLDMEDGISIYPKQAEYLCLAELDPRFRQVYRVGSFGTYNPDRKSVV